MRPTAGTRIGPYEVGVLLAWAEWGIPYRATDTSPKGQLAPKVLPAAVPVKDRLEYAQARHFHVDSARVRVPQDRGRVERGVPGIRDDCFAGEVLLTLDGAHVRAPTWCLDEYGDRG